MSAYLAMHIHNRLRTRNEWLCLRLCAQDDVLPTLAEVFSSVPKRCGFDIEIKMTTGPEVERTPPEEINRVVSSIWDLVGICTDDGGEGEPREIFFSSFDPGGWMC